jgi:hypothetical protein
MGEGPFYTFYTPYHLCHLEAPLTVARAVLFGDAAIAPIAGPFIALTWHSLLYKGGPYAKEESLFDSVNREREEKT